MKKETNQIKTKQIICRMDDDLFSELEILRDQLGINWSFQVRKFLQDKIVELKPTIKMKI